MFKLLFYQAAITKEMLIVKNSKHEPEKIIDILVTPLNNHNYKIQSSLKLYFLKL